MWRMSKQSRVDVKNEQEECMLTISAEDKVFTCVCKKKILDIATILCLIVLY